METFILPDTGSLDVYQRSTETCHLNHCDFASLHWLHKTCWVDSLLGSPDRTVRLLGSADRAVRHVGSTLYWVVQTGLYDYWVVQTGLYDYWVVQTGQYDMLGRLSTGQCRLGSTTCWVDSLLGSADRAVGLLGIPDRSVRLLGSPDRAVRLLGSPDRAVRQYEVKKPRDFVISFSLGLATHGLPL